MKVYAIYHTSERVFVRFGMNGGREWGYSLFRGHPVLFEDYHAARVAVDSFDNPEDYEIKVFKEVSA